MSTFGLLHDIFTYSAGSLVIGVLLTIAFVVLLFVIIKGFFPKSAFSPLSIVVGVIFACFLGYRMVSLCGAVSLKWMCDDFEEYMTSLIPPELRAADMPVDKEFTDQMMGRALDEFPIFSSFVGSGTFEGMSMSEVAHVMADTLNSFLNQFILEAILWSLFYLAVAAALVVWTMKKEWDNRLGQSHRRPTSSSGSYTRQRYVSHGHSRYSRFRR